MNLTDYLAKDTLSNIAKGRYNKQQVEDMFQKAVYGAAIEAENVAFEYAILTILQTLHYDFGFGATRLARLVDLTQPALDAFDARAYDMNDMRQALQQDAKFDLEFVWRKKHDS